MSRASSSLPHNKDQYLRLCGAFDGVYNDGPRVDAQESVGSLSPVWHVEDKLVNRIVSDMCWPFYVAEKGLGEASVPFKHCNTWTHQAFYQYRKERWRSHDSGTIFFQDMSNDGII